MPVKQHKLMLIGLGTVARGLIQILLEKSSILVQDHGTDFKIVAVCTGSRGNLYAPQGIDLQELLDLSRTHEPFFKDLSSLDTLSLIRHSNADIVVELSPTNLEDGEPAITHCRVALESGKHVVSGNKGPAALAYASLKDLAERQNLAFLNEATVLSGTPVFSFARRALAGIRVHQITGILSGSTNFILGEMESGKTYDQALAEAGKRGYLEQDPRGDIDGHDAQAKLVILGNVLLKLPLHLKDVQRAGIAHISREDVQTARAAGERWKLIATISVHGDQFQAAVKPERLPLEHPLAQMNGTTNALTFSTDLLGEVTVSGPGAGGVATGYAILADLLIINEGYRS